jgi:hypothetical protein
MGYKINIVNSSTNGTESTTGIIASTGVYGGSTAGGSGMSKAWRLYWRLCCHIVADDL